MGREFTEADFADAPKAKREFADADFAAPGATAAPTGPKKAEPSWWEAAIHGGAQGGFPGVAPALTGAAVAAWDNPVSRAVRRKLGVAAPATDAFGKEIPGPASIGEAYRAGRDASYGAIDESQAAHRKTFGAAEIAGAVVNPVLSPVKGATILSAAGRAAGAGALHAAGSSRADLTKGEVGDFAKDVGIGAVVGGTVGGAAAGIAKGAKSAAESVVNNVERRITNEVAEGGERNVGKRVREKLSRAQKAIADEVISGPDGAVVRRAMQAPDAAKGQDILSPVLKKVSDARNAGYEAFEKAGKDAVDRDVYVDSLRVAQKAARSGDSPSPALADAIEEYIGRIGRQFDHADGVNLRQLRALTTEVQAPAFAASDAALGARLKRDVSRVATAAMDDMLTRAAKGDKTLEAAATSIRGANERFFPLLSVNDALKSRVPGEASGRSGLVRTADKLSNVSMLLGGYAGIGGIAGAQGAWSDPEKAAEALVKGAAGALVGRGVPALARGIDRAATTAAIKAIRAGGGRAAKGEVAAGAGSVAGQIGSLVGGNVIGRPTAVAVARRLRGEDKEDGK